MMLTPKEVGRMKKGLCALVLGALLTSGCAVSVARKMCIKSGYAEGSPQHQQCSTSLREQWKAEGRRDLQAMLVGGLIVAGAAAAPSQPSTAPTRLTHRYALVREWWAPQGRFCQYANGSVLNMGNGFCAMNIEAP
jgi:hypothetical protein